MVITRMTVVSSSPHPSVETRYYVLWPNGSACAMTAAQLLNATKGWAYASERHECLEHWSNTLPPYGIIARNPLAPKTPAQLEKLAGEHHTRAVLRDGLPKPELRCEKCQKWHDTPCKAATWDEPEGCPSARGWLRRGEVCVGFYLDYGPHYRHRTVHDKRCYAGQECTKCQPGTFLVVRYPEGPQTPKTSRWVETVEAARNYVEFGEDKD